jgi:restriction endonuclease Mrr
MRPLLAQLRDGDIWTSEQIRGGLADQLSLTEQDRAIENPSGRNRFTNLVAWALHHLFRARLIEKIASSQYRISARGREVLASHPNFVGLDVCMSFEEWHESRRTRRASAKRAASERRTLAPAVVRSSAPSPPARDGDARTRVCPVCNGRGFVGKDV